MCGFAGMALKALGAKPDEATLQRMTRTLEHRGPDDEGFVSLGPLGLGFRRLSIIDLAGGHQPIEHQDLPIAIVGNGEIYNFRELRAGLESRGARFRTGSDIETILHLYLEKGEHLVDDLVGMYAFAIADYRDQKRPRLTMARDRLGIKPLYWGESANGLYFGSELKAVLESREFAREMPAEGLLDYLVQGYFTGEPSAFAGIQRLLPGHTLTWDPEAGVKTRRYWDLPLEDSREPAQDQEILEWIDRVVSERLISEVPLGAFLSGGIDSNAVVDSMARTQDNPPIVCTVGFREKSHDEVDLARLTAERLGAVQHIETLEPDPKLAIETLPWFYDEPLADTSTVPTYLVSKMARRHMTVVLSGDGGDETFAGYRRYVYDYAENRLRSKIGLPGTKVARAMGSLYPKLDWAPRFLRAKSFLTGVGNDPALAFWHSVSPMTRAQVLELLHPDVVAKLGDYDPFHRFEEIYRRPKIDCPLYRAQYGDFHSNLPDKILAKVDRASMANSLEVRVPLLDHRFVERFVHLPAGEKVRGGRGKHRLRESLRGRLHADILDGRKKGFDTPIGSWIRGPLANHTAEAIENLPADWFQKPILRQRLAEHMGKRRDWSQFLWSLIVLEQWRRRHSVSALAS